MNHTLSIFVALLAVWAVALVPLLLLDRQAAAPVAAVIAAYVPMDLGRP